jgi:ATP-dependent DNA helicase RecQ
LISVSNDQFRTLSLTPLGRDVMAGRIEEVQMAVPIVRSPTSPRKRGRSRSGTSSTGKAGVLSQSSADEPAAGRVFEALREWRRDQARERGVPPYVVMHDRTLEAIATSLPRSLHELSDVPGIGPAKLAAHGEAILSIVTSSST